MATIRDSLVIFSKFMHYGFQNFAFYLPKIGCKTTKSLARKTASLFKEKAFLTTLVFLWPATLYATMEQRRLSEEEAEKTYLSTRAPHTPFSPGEANTSPSAYSELPLNARHAKDQEHPSHQNTMTNDDILASLTDYFISKPPFSSDNCVSPLDVRSALSETEQRLSSSKSQGLTGFLENTAASYEKEEGDTLHAFHCSRQLTQQSLSRLQGMYAHWISLLYDFLEDSSQGSYNLPSMGPEKFLDKMARFSCRHAPIRLGNFHFIFHIASVEQRKSFKIQLADSHLLPLIRLEEFPRARKNLILFLGSSSTGKTSVADEFSKLAKSSIILEYDHRLHKTVLDFLSHQKHPRFPQLYRRFGLPILHLIFCHPEDLFLKREISYVENARELLKDLQELQDISLPHLKELYKRASMLILEEAKILVCLGKTVIVQAADNEALLSFSEFDPCTILFYCPFSDLATRVEQRNKIAFLENKPLEFRHPLGIYRQFSKIFRVKRSKDSARSLGVVVKDVVSHYVERALIIDPLYRPSGFINTELFVSDLLYNMEFTKEKSAEILPRYNYNFYIDTSLVTPLEGARGIQNFYTALSQAYHQLSRKRSTHP